MKQTIMHTLFSIVFVFFAVPLHAAEQKAPAAVIKEAAYQFAPVVEGTAVVHEYIVENTGTAPLQIDRIKTGCGCTTADFTKTIPPGGKGNISIKGNTTGYGGNIFERHITVFTNDPQNPEVSLIMKGQVDKFADITPVTAVLKGNADAVVETQVTVQPEKNHLFKVTGSHTDKALEGKIEYNLIVLENGYVLKIKNIQRLPGNYFGRIFLKTDNPDKPEIAIPVSGKIG
jgi:hypothetical protein